MKMNLTTSEKNRGIVRFLLMSMLLCLLIHPAQAQDRVTVTGRLTDTSHAPLIGASVIEQGTTNGVTTDTEGNYQISVSGNATLGFSFIGYKPQNVAVMNRTAIDVTHDGYFLPINDAMPDKSLRTDELYHAVAIAYAATRDPASSAVSPSSSLARS